MSDNEINETEIDLRLAMLRHWYGDLLSEEQWREVREGVSAKSLLRSPTPFVPSSLDTTTSRCRSSRRIGVRTSR